MSEVMPAQSNAALSAGTVAEVQVLTFELEGEIFALEATMVREILDMSPTTVVPHAKRFVSAIINFRGKVIPLADLRIAFGMEVKAATIDSRIVVIEIALDGTPTLIGLLTDRVNEVTTLNLRQREAPPTIGMRYRPEFIQGLFQRDGSFVILPALSEILAASPKRSKLTLAGAA